MGKRPDGVIRQHEIAGLDLRFSRFRLPAPADVARLRREVEHEGIRNPVLVSDAVAAGQLVVLDGLKRVQVARELGEERIEVRVVGLDAVTAPIALLQANHAQRGITEVEEGLIVQCLHREHGLSQVEIAERLGHHKSWVCRRLGLVERLERQVQEDLRLGLLSASVVREVVRLPRGTQADAARAIAAHRLSARQAAQFVGVLAATPAHERAALLRRPLDHLPAGREQERYPTDPRLGETGNRVRQNLLRLGAASHRLIEIARHQVARGFPSAEVCLLRELGAQVLPTVREALGCVDGLLSSGGERNDAGM